MPERITLPQPEQASVGAKDFEIEAFVVNFKANFITIYLVSPDGNIRKQRTYENIPVIIKNLMTGNYTVKSLPQKILEKIAKDDYNDTASVTVVP